MEPNIIKQYCEDTIHKEHILELQKYTFGELIEALGNLQGISPDCVGEDDLISHPIQDGKRAKDRMGCAGGPGIVIIYRDELISKKDCESIKAYIKKNDA